MRFRHWVIAGAMAGAASCTSAELITPTEPTVQQGGSASGLTAPVPEGPAAAAEVTTLRPTLTVRNGTSPEPGVRTYEFQVSDSSSFASTTQASVFAVVASRNLIPEGANGVTSYTVDVDLQPTTRFFWRARMSQGLANSDWSVPRDFTTKVTGYNIPGELYDPLAEGSTVGERNGSTEFVTGRGLRVNNSNSWVRYRLPQVLPAGEFSVEVEGLRPNGPGDKMKVISMNDASADLITSPFQMSAQYRGSPGNPDNAIAFKMLFGSEAFKLEPDFGQRSAGVRLLDPSRWYLWKVTWSNGIRLTVQEGIGGPVIYDLSQTTAGTYNPSQQFAFLGANNGPLGAEVGSWPGVTYRNLWLSNKPRPASLGSALKR
jgi:hypothetical protein